ncbi:CASP-like protein 1F1 [Chenopodium quinoa]|uniref:CASP-like protein 1F1 n=1 Tax=Chenopodium quinoa TaxID=63459 RepID=UPI000B7725AD|nr:CASP-like protein 1F1 [Chenopodium quinoa]
MSTYEEDKQGETLQKIKQRNKVDVIQIGLRTAALATSIVASSIVFTCNQTAIIFGMQMVAKYSYSSAFKFFAYATAIASLFSLLSLILTFIRPRIASTKANHHLFFFLHDLVTMSLLLAGCAAATAIGYVAQYGYEQSGWMPICDHFHSFCHKAIFGIVFGYFSCIIFFVLTIINATKSITNTHYFPSQI